MKNSYFSYIKINTDDNSIFTSGISFKDFYDGLEIKPNNLLIIKGFPHPSDYSLDLGLDYVTESDMEEFSISDIYSFGDFSCVDFKNISNLDDITDMELAALLYFGHTSKYLESFMINSLNNSFLYYSHDDDWFTKIYFAKIENYIDIIEHKILTQLKGRKKSINRIPIEIMSEIYEDAKTGIVIDFECAYFTSVNIYTIGDYKNPDSIHDELDRLRLKSVGKNLDYNARTKKWTISKKCY